MHPMRNTAIRTFVGWLVWLLVLSVTTSLAHGGGGGGGHSTTMSRHLVISNLTSVILIAEGAETTEGPYFESEANDYVASSDMTMAARAGSRGVSTDRTAVLDAIPLNLTLTLYDVDGATATTGTELSGAEVFLWHCDGWGVYSAVDETEGQQWLRGKQVTGTNGVVVFQTILPGWYTGRVIHYHVRIRLPGETSTFAATSQFFVADSDLAHYSQMYPYNESSQSITSLASDGIYNRLDDSIASALTLNLEGSMDATTNGVTASIQIGLRYDATTTTTDPPSSPSSSSSLPPPSSSTTGTTTITSSSSGDGGGGALLWSISSSVILAAVSVVASFGI